MLLLVVEFLLQLEVLFQLLLQVVLVLLLFQDQLMLIQDLIRPLMLQVIQMEEVLLHLLLLP
jgi:hypothetical protein